MRDRAVDKGQYGEKLAARFLKRQGYRIIERNFHSGKHEIDIIAQQRSDKSLVFVEVKARSLSEYGLPCEAVDSYKQRFLRLAATDYLKRNNLLEAQSRFDVIEVYLEDKSINHIVNAF